MSANWICTLIPRLKQYQLLNVSRDSFSFVPSFWLLALLLGHDFPSLYFGVSRHVIASNDNDKSKEDIVMCAMYQRWFSCSISLSFI